VVEHSSNKSGVKKTPGRKKKEVVSGVHVTPKAVVKPVKKVQDAPVEQYFILCNGQPVKNVKELADALENIRDDVFTHHVTPDRNDFATWVHDVFKDVELAEELAGVKDKGNTRIVLYKHIVRKLTQ
jgi:hypothetical protein